MDPVTFAKTQPDRALAIVSATTGLVLLVVGWYGVSGQGVIAGQIPYVVSCGLGGLFALTTGCTLWISADLRDEWRKLDAIEAALLEQARAIRDTGSTRVAESDAKLSSAMGELDASAGPGTAIASHNGSPAAGASGASRKRRTVRVSSSAGTGV